MGLEDFNETELKRVKGIIRKFRKQGLPFDEAQKKAIQQMFEEAEENLINVEKQIGERKPK